MEAYHKRKRTGLDMSGAVMTVVNAVFTSLISI